MKVINTCSPEYFPERTSMRESRDCVVRALAVAFNTDYKSAHDYTKNYLNRPNRQGVRFVSIFNGRDPVSKHTTPLAFEKRYLRYLENNNIKFKNMIGAKGTTKTGLYLKKFLGMYPEGRYIIISSGHAYTVVDGVVYGNPNDDRTYVKVAYKINKSL